MRRLSLLALVLCLAFPAYSKADDQGTSVSSTITKVTVFSDRAEVHREASVSLGGTTFVFEKLPGWVDEGSVRVGLVPADAGRIEDVRVVRTYLARSDDEKVLKAQEDVQAVTDELVALNDEVKVLESQAAQIEAIKAFSLEKLAKDMPTRDIKIETYDQTVKYIANALREIAKSKRAIEQKRRQLTPELAARQRKLQELMNLTQLEETSVLVAVEGNGRAVVELTYMLPGATWEPAHELRAAATDSSKVELTSYAVVSQTSGEDWSSAELTFSTQSSTESARIPELGALTLGDTGVQPRALQERAASFSRAMNAFEGQNRLWNEVNPANNKKVAQMDVYDNNLDQLYAVQTKTAAIFQEMQTRGTTARYKGAGKVAVRADGYPVRVRIGKALLAAEQAIVAAPELSLNAIRTVKMTNTGAQPLLPGGVALYQDGSFLGMTDLAFVAEGESFSVFMGVADQVKLARVLDRKFSTIQRGERTTLKVAFDVTVENLSDDTVVMDLTERIPLSDNRDIEVDKVEVTSKAGKKDPDSKGLVKWHLTLKGKEAQKFRVSYRVEYPTAVMQEMRRSRGAMKMKVQMEMQQKSMDFDGEEMELNAPAAAPAQIMNLEDVL